ncbi:ABC transporter substrate-binding protein [Methanococcus maripaludis]|uniref:Cystine-binding periplasmic protein n=1 Tax=Methanococcus maripaludis TaxID=39152 RepID=A0A2L1CCA3_METMI|nr:transporter substrate-binding domain-containing protein [Methanococcus maripaludis]AVB76991.1 Cystine-binding periplasmic protein precursor [Methanococcus maripaludis]MBA2863503.1 polar amino acid transport system substrate-binding protein [Methanococcus maripaludis]MBB6496493.1 polar amino acid transport system substrate-binding protein [Methanococcus maripaludis]
MKRHSIGITILLFLLSISIISGCISSQNTMKRGTLTVGVCAQYPPTIYEENGNLAGFDFDLMNEIAKRMKLNTNFKIYNSKSELFDALEKNEVDCIGSRTVNYERRKFIDFTRVYYYDSVRVAVPESSSVTMLKELKGKNLGVIEGSVSSELVESYLTNVGCKCIYYDTPENLTYAVENGEVDAVIGHEMYIEHISTKCNVQKRYLDEKLSVSYWAIPINKNNPNLRNSINDVLLEMENDGTLDELKLKWYGKY